MGWLLGSEGKPTSGSIIIDGRPYDSMAEHENSCTGTSASGFGSYRDKGGNFHNTKGEANAANRRAEENGGFF